MPTAAVIIVGDEILSGKFADENGPWLIRRLRELGCDLRRLVVVADAPDAIGDEVRRCAAACDHVLTTGGVGPTHDDRTFEGVGRGLDLPLAPHPELVALLERFGLPPSETNLHMCTVPVGSVLERGPTGRGFPTVRARNVWVFPGVPVLMRARFDEVSPAFVGSPVATARWSSNRRETELAALISQVAEEMPTVAVGSYPRYDDGGREVELVVTFESRDAGAVASAEGRLRELLAVVDPGLHSEGRAR